MKLETRNSIVENEPLARYTAWRIGGPARRFAVAGSAGELAELVAWGTERELPIFVLGGGSNVLIADGGYPGLVIRNRAVAQRVDEREGRPVLWTEAGAPTAGTARRLAAQGYGGLVWAEGLPGTIGGAVYGNAGCYGGDIAQQLVRAWVLRDGEVEEWPVERFEYGYRTSVLKQGVRGQGRGGEGERGRGGDREAEFGPHPLTPAPVGCDGSGGRELSSPLLRDSAGEGSGVRAKLETRNLNLESTDFLTPDPRPLTPTVLAAELHLTHGDPQQLRAEIASIAELRKGKTPSGSSCGSVFKNPPGTTAGTLLDQAGLKGATAGGAIVSEKHANYIVNRGDASAADVLRLSGIMRQRVLQVFGVELELEVQVVGDQP